MRPNDSQLSSFDAILREHAEIEMSVRRFAAMIAVDVRRQPGGAVALGRDLLRLRDSLKLHFDREERGGFFDEILVRSPHLDRTVTALRNEHGGFLLRLGRIAEAFGEPEDLDLEIVLGSLRRFAGEYLRHEESEIALLMDTYNEDLGSPD